ncbi:MAG: sulfotransferase [Bacteroidales bacterium]|nr:sulfotransferase [Candidatus Physcousia equi]
MGLIEFSKLPVNTLVGADWKTFKSITHGQLVVKKGKYRLTKFVCRLLSTCAGMQRRRYRKRLADKPLAADPVFILGHWRSGTTFVHNIFAQDPRFGFTTTYQTVFPHYIMAMQWLFKPIMGWLMPSHRPTDNMELAPDLPQEEEFALQNTCPYTYYNFWFFPQRMQDYCDRYLTMKRATDDELADFKDKFMQLVKTSLWNTAKLYRKSKNPEERNLRYEDLRYLSKNPPHTGKVKTLVEMFPNAKFIYLIRNPYTVFESSRSFFTNTIAPLQLHSIPLEDMEHNILRNYAELYDAYQSQKQYIPKGNLVEVRFEDIERDPMAETERIYRELGLPGWDRASKAVQAYVEKKKGYKKNKYEYNERTIQLVNQYWMRALKDWNYDLL